MTTSYTPQDWLSGLSTTKSGTTTSLPSNISYSGACGAAQQMTGASVANGTYNEAVQDDGLAVRRTGRLWAARVRCMMHLAKGAGWRA